MEITSFVPIVGKTPFTIDTNPGCSRDLSELEVPTCTPLPPLIPSDNHGETSIAGMANVEGSEPNWLHGRNGKRLS